MNRPKRALNPSALHCQPSSFKMHKASTNLVGSDNSIVPSPSIINFKLRPIVQEGGASMPGINITKYKQTRYIIINRYFFIWAKFYFEFHFILIPRKPVFSFYIFITSAHPCLIKINRQTHYSHIRQ